ncbi:MAG: integrase core domain-containing protein [bacterium]
MIQLPAIRHRFRALRTPQDRMRHLAMVLGLSAKAKNRLEWFIWFQTKGKSSVALTCRHFGIPKKTWYKWAKRFDPLNLKLLEDRPKAPKNKRRREITYVQKSRVLELRCRFLRYGKVKIAQRYAEEHGETISVWKVQKVIEDSKLYYHPAKCARTAAKRKRFGQRKRITELKLKHRTGFLFRLDSVVRYWQGTKRYILTAVDTNSRLAFAHMYTSHSSRGAADFLKRLHALVDGKIENLQTDNGSEFHKHFEEAAKELKINHYWSRAKTPKDNAQCERFNRTLNEEFIQMGNMITDPKVFNRNLTEWLVEYNFRRPHQSLGYVSPINFIYKHERLLPMYPSSTDPCPIANLVISSAQRFDSHF